MGDKMSDWMQGTYLEGWKKALNTEKPKWFQRNKKTGEIEEVTDPQEIAKLRGDAFRQDQTKRLVERREKRKNGK